MSTLAETVWRRNGIECGRDPHAFLRSMEVDSSLFLREQLRERLAALDDLDARFGGPDEVDDADAEDESGAVDTGDALDAVDAMAVTDRRSPSLHQRAKALRNRLEAANTKLYHFLRP